MKAKNVIEYGAITEKNWELNLCDMSPYQRKYTFYNDFGIAEWCEVYAGEKGAVLDTFKRAISGWKSNYKAFTEIVLVLNHKSWAFAGYVDSEYLGCTKEQADAFKDLYIDLYYKARDMFYKEFEGNSEAQSYFFDVTD